MLPSLSSRVGMARMTRSKLGVMKLAGWRCYSPSRPSSIASCLLLNGRRTSMMSNLNCCCCSFCSYSSSSSGGKPPPPPGDNNDGGSGNSNSTNGKKGRCSATNTTKKTAASENANSIRVMSESSSPSIAEEQTNNSPSPPQHSSSSSQQVPTCGQKPSEQQLNEHQRREKIQKNQEVKEAPRSSSSPHSLPPVSAQHFTFAAPSTRHYVQKIRLLEKWQADDELLCRAIDWDGGGVGGGDEGNTTSTGSGGGGGGGGINHWSINFASKAMLMIDKQPVVVRRPNKVTAAPMGEHGVKDSSCSPMKMAVFETRELRQRLNDYGLEIGALNGCLLDAVEADEEGNGDGGQAGGGGGIEAGYQPLFGFALRTMQPPAESGIPAERVRGELAGSLGGELLNLRYTMLTMSSEWDRNMLAKFQSLTRWYHTYKHCPHCASPLQQRVSKMNAVCIRCDQVYYPQVSPAVICLVRSEDENHCLLVRHRQSAASVFTCIAGFVQTGETLAEAVRREVAEEVGIDCWDVAPMNPAEVNATADFGGDTTQPWPLPAASLMCAFTAKADPKAKLDIARDELEHAEWFPRGEVVEAVARIDADPMLGWLRRSNGAGGGTEDTGSSCSSTSSSGSLKQQLRYVPPKGAIAYRMISHWAKGPTKKHEAGG